MLFFIIIDINPSGVHFTISENTDCHLCYFIKMIKWFDKEKKNFEKLNVLKKVVQKFVIPITFFKC